MADGRIEIKFDTDTKQIELADKSIKALGEEIRNALKPPTTTTTADTMQSIGDGAQNATESVEKLGTEVDEVAKTPPNTETAEGIEDIGDKAQKSTGGVKNLVTAMGLLKVAGVAVQMINRSLGDAVKRVDTMRSFPRMMQQVGFSAEETEQSIEKLSDGIDGLPTALDEVVSTTQQLALTTGDLEQATDLTLALNNAFLASGSSGADASRGLQQFSQMLSSGKVDMQSWRTLLETMPLALQTVAENFGYTGAAAKNDLYAALQDGSITFDEFSQALIDANNAQGGFAELAKINSEGMATSWKNIQTAVVKGVADVITALDELVTEVTGKNIAQHFDTLKTVVGGAFSVMSTSIRNATPYVQSSITMLQRFSPIIAGLATAYGALQVINTVTSFWQASTKAIQAAEIATKGITLVTSGLTAAKATETGALTLSQVAFGLLTGKITVATVATQLFNATVGALTSPVGLAVAAIGLLAGGAAIIYSSFKDATVEMSNFNEKMDDIVLESEALRTDLGDTATAFSDQISDIDNNEAALKRVVDRLIDLQGKESKSATDKELLKGYVDELNGSVEGLNLSYDAEADALNLTKDAIYDRIEAQSALLKSNAAQERLTEIYSEQVELQEQISKNLKTIQEAGGIEVLKGSPNYGDVINETQGLVKQYESLSESIQIVEGIYTESMSQITTVTEEGAAKQITALESLSDEQKSVIEDLKAIYKEYEDVATNAMSKIETSSEIGANTMLENLKHNQQAIKDYADNLSLIEEEAKRLGSDGAFVEYLRSLGPEAAGEVANLAEQLTTESDVFAELVSTFDDGAKTAAEAMATALSEFELPEGSIDIITKVEEMLSSQIESSGLSEIGGLIMDEVVTGLSETPEDITTSGETVGQSFGDGAISGVASRKEELGTSGTEGAQSAVTGFESGSVGAHTAGVMLGSGLNSGLQSMHTTVVNTAVAMANAAVQAINSALGVASPAKEGIYSGKMLGQGLVLGGEREIGAIEEMGTKMANAAIPDFAGVNLEQALNLPRFSGLQTTQAQSTQSSVTGLETLGRKLDALIAKQTDVYMDGEKVGGIVSPTVDRSIGRESIYEERWGT